MDTYLQMGMVGNLNLFSVYSKGNMNNEKNLLDSPI